MEILFPNYKDPRITSENLKSAVFSPYRCHGICFLVSILGCGCYFGAGIIRALILIVAIIAIAIIAKMVVLTRVLRFSNGLTTWRRLENARNVSRINSRYPCRLTHHSWFTIVLDKILKIVVTVEADPKRNKN